VHQGVWRVGEHNCRLPDTMLGRTPFLHSSL
jgi:hypothetical protein